MASLPQDVHLMLQMFLYFAAVLIGLVICVPIALTKNSFDGSCILYGEPEWTDATHIELHYGQASACHFVLYVHVLCSMLYGVGMGGYYAFAVYRNRTNKDIAYEMWVMPFLLSNALVIFFVFVAACVISVGFSIWCSSVTKGHHASSCAALEGIPVIIDGKEVSEIGHHYYSFMTTAQVASWLAFGVFSAQLALGFLRFYRNRKKRSQETFQGVTTSDTQQIADHTLITA